MNRATCVVVMAIASACVVSVAAAPQSQKKEIRFRNIFIREIPDAEAKRTLSQFPAK